MELDPVERDLLRAETELADANAAIDRQADAIVELRAELDAAHARMHRALDVARAETREAHAWRRLVERERDTARARVAELETDLARVRGYQAELAERCYRKGLELDELRVR